MTDGQSTTFTHYLMSVGNAAPVAHDFIVSLMPRIERAYDMGETVEMIAEEIRFRWSVRKPRALPTPGSLALRVVRVGR